MTPAARARWRLRLPVLLASATAWVALATRPGPLAWPGLCAGSSSSAASSSWAAPAFWAAPSAQPLDLALALNRPAALAAGWALMLAAMMAPLLVAPLRHIHDRSLARRRGRSMALFLAGYAGCWMLAGVVLLASAMAVRLAVPGRLAPLMVVILQALLWQVSPAKQRCLNRCHAAPPLAAFGPAADRGALGFGLAHGGWCVGACWALMLVPLLAAQAHLAAMAAVALWLGLERLERSRAPRWGWRGPGRALRIIAARIG